MDFRNFILLFSSTTREHDYTSSNREIFSFRPHSSRETISKNFNERFCPSRDEIFARKSPGEERIALDPDSCREIPPRFFPKEKSWLRAANVLPQR